MSQLFTYTHSLITVLGDLQAVTLDLSVNQPFLFYSFKDSKLESRRIVNRSWSIPGQLFGVVCKDPGFSKNASVNL